MSPGTTVILILGIVAGLVAVFVLGRLYINKKMKEYRAKEEQQKRQQLLFEQTAAALVNAIDALGTFTHGHSSRVAEYSKKIAELAGKSEEECNEIYYAALLHDVGNIGIDSDIINKDGKLTQEEYAAIKEHPTKGDKILRSISDYPYLNIGAKYHHERYDGKGYPEGLKGEDIPEYARIIAVADAYDAMTSKRSYRDQIQRQKVREELVKGSGTQFDPEFARLMLHLIDKDSEYEMKEREEIGELDGKYELLSDDYRSTVSDGILLTPCLTTLRMKVNPIDKNSVKKPMPSLILFDALDGRIHKSERGMKELAYFEYGEIRFDGHIKTTGARKMKTETTKTVPGEGRGPREYLIRAIRIKDHALIKIIGNKETLQVTVALPDSSRFLYLGLTGEYVRISDLVVEKTDEEAPAGYIPRIAEEISYIDGPAGDLDNIQVDGYRTCATKGIPVTDGLQISFHTMSLPTARLVWHCPFVVLFSADDGRVEGENYVEYMLQRFEGEGWASNPSCTVSFSNEQNESFEGWDAWKKLNKTGYDSVVTFARKDNTITITTENGGIKINTTMSVDTPNDKIYAALSGDQCAITNIRIKEKGES